MGLVIYDGKKLIPGPLVSITKQYNKTNSNEIIGATYGIQLNGTIVAYKGSPKTDRTFWSLSGYPPDENVAANARLAAILRKQEAIRDLFSDDGRTFEIQSDDGSQPLTCNPRILAINFEEGIWTDTCKYTVTMEADKIYPFAEDNFTYMINDASETWSLDTDETPENEFIPRTYRVTHSVSAVGKRFYDSTGTLQQEPWIKARDYVISRLGINSQFLLSSGISNLPSYYGGYNHVRAENKDEKGGAYSVVESWILTSGTALEDFNIDLQQDATSNIARVSITGNITGLEIRNSGDLSLNTSKYTNALSKFTQASGLALSRAQSYSGRTLNISPLSQRISKNPVNGTISYGFDYDTRPSNLISGAISEVISLTDTLATNVVAIIPVLGRAIGPVLQSIGTSEPLTRQLSIEVVMPIPSMGTGSAADIRTAFITNKPTTQVATVVNALNPSNGGYSQVYITSNNETWNAKEGRYSRSIAWVYEQ